MGEFGGVRMMAMEIIKAPGGREWLRERLLAKERIVKFTCLMVFHDIILNIQPNR